MTNFNVIIRKWAIFVTEHDIWIQWNTGKDIYAHTADKLKENKKIAIMVMNDWNL